MQQEMKQNSMRPGKWYNSTCKMCLHTCNTRIHVSDNGVVDKIEGQPTSPSNRGRLCPKGNSAIMRHYDPNRFLAPLKRTNPEKGQGIDPKWEEISWDEALDTVAAQLKKTMDDDPRKLLAASTNFQKFAHFAAGAIWNSNNFFSPVGNYCGAGYHVLNGIVHSAFAGVNDVKRCNYWVNHGGGDGFSSHLHAAAQAGHVADARMDRNMHVLVIEPRLSIGAAKANEWVPIRPATDKQFAMGLLHVLVREDLMDHKFLKNDTNAPYLVGEDGLFVRNEDGQVYMWDTNDNQAKLWNDQAFSNREQAMPVALYGEYEVNGVKCKPAFQLFKENLDEATPEAVEKITTVPAATTERIAREMHKAADIGATIEIEGKSYPLRPIGYNYYRGAQGHKTSAQANHAYKLINFLLGSIDAPGGHLGSTLNDEGQVTHNHIEAGENGLIVSKPHQLHPAVPFSFPPNETTLLGYFPCGADAGQLNVETFHNPEYWGMDFKPTTLLTCHSNPLWGSSGRFDKWHDLMVDLDFIFAIDLIPNDTNLYADIILPVTDPLESWNMCMNEPPQTEGMCLRQPVVPPLGNVKSEEDILNELAERTGQLDQWNNIQNFVYNLFKEPELALEPGIKYGDKEIAERKGKLWNGKDLDWYVEHGHAVTDRLPHKWFRPWEGLRLHFYIEEFIVGRNELHAQMEEANVPFINDWEWDDYQALPKFVLDPVHEVPEQFDMYAITFKDIQINFSESLTNPWINDITFNDPVHNAVLINSKTARAKGLEHGDLVEMESPYGGVIYGRLGLSEEIHPDTIGISNALSRLKTKHSIARHGGGRFNDLLPTDLRNTDAVSGQAETVARVKLTKVDSVPSQYLNETSVFEIKEEI
jgi:anaerobic selenocysteine-containing dehydrogenase